MTSLFGEGVCNSGWGNSLVINIDQAFINTKCKELCRPWISSGVGPTQVGPVNQRFQSRWLMDSVEVFYMIRETPLTDRRVSNRTNHDPEKVKISSVLIKHPDLASSLAKWAHIFLPFLLSFGHFSSLQCFLLFTVKSYQGLVSSCLLWRAFLHSSTPSNVSLLFWTLDSNATNCFTHLALRCLPGPCICFLLLL